MRRGVEHLKTHHSAGLPLKPGGRKTSITLAAFSELKAEGVVERMLVIAPLRVCRQVWRQEGAKWTQFRHLRFALLHGSKKDDVLRTDADIYLINPEGVAWLCAKFQGRQLPFDIITIDELTRFKNHQSERSKALRPRIDKVQWKWGLTGSLAPNGYLDLFGQQLVLDGGAALGRYITHYRDQYFQLGYNGFDYDLMPGAEKRIVERIAPYWMHVDESDYSQLPPLVANPIMLDLDKASRATYERMKKDMLAELPEGVVTAANAAATYSKLSQMANGAVYAGEQKQSVAHLHDLKLDAIEELLEELNGEPLLVGYEFNHDLERLRERFGVLDKATGKKVLPYLGKGTSAKQEDEWIAAWNRGELPLLCAHPASAGHGLNLQGGSAANVAWFGITWDFELYDQFIRRIYRSGTEAKQVFNHLLIVRGTIDELKLAALTDKDTTQTRLLQALNTQILREIADTAGVQPGSDDRRLPMVQRLSRQSGEAQQSAAPAQQEQPVKPKGWGQRPAALAEGVAEAQLPQRERIQETISQRQPTESPADQARQAFSQDAENKRAAIGQENYGDMKVTGAPEVAPVAEPEKPKTTRSRKPAAEPETAVMDVAPYPGYIPDSDEKMELLKMVFSDPDMAVTEGLEIADALLAWVREA